MSLGCKGKEQRAKSKEQRAKREGQSALLFASAGKAPLLSPRDDGVEWISLLERAFKHARPSQLQNQYRVRKGGLPALLVSSQSTPVKDKKPADALLKVYEYSPATIKPFNVKAQGFELES